MLVILLIGGFREHMYYTEEQIEKVRSGSDIVQIIGRYVNLKRSGSGYVGLCPFHSEKTPSFSVNPARQMYKCFGCGVAGSVITFVMEYENLETLGLDKSKIITRWQTKINMIPKYNLAQGINAAIDYRTIAKKLYIEGKKLQVNKNGIRDNKQEINADRRIKHEIAKQIDEEHKFSDLLNISGEE